MRSIILHSMCSLLACCMLLGAGCARHSVTLSKQSEGIIAADSIYLTSGFGVQQGSVCELRGNRIVVGSHVGPIKGRLRILGRTPASTLQLPSEFDGLAVLGDAAHLEISSVRVASVSIYAFVVADCGQVVLNNIAFGNVRAKTLVAGRKVSVELRNIKLLDTSDINCILDIGKLPFIGDASVNRGSEMKYSSRLALHNCITDELSQIGVIISDATWGAPSTDIVFGDQNVEIGRASCRERG